MKIATADQIRHIDKLCIEEIGIPGIVLMEHAGRQTVSEIQHRFPDVENLKILVIAGKGNNGGDGFVVARHLWNTGAEVKVYLIGKLSDLKHDAAINANILVALGIRIHECTSDLDLSEMKTDICNSDIVIDALFGTGLSKQISGLYAKVIELINTSSSYVVSVDIPSGLSSDSLSVTKPIIKADLTVTFGLLKPSLVFYPTASFAGSITVADISIPPFIIDRLNIRGEIVTPFHFNSIFTSRNRDAHKGSFGHLLVVAGSPGKTGAATLSSQAGLKVGSGLVTAVIPASLNSVLETKLTEAMSYPVKGYQDKIFSNESLDEILSLLPGKSAVVIGPGIGLHPETKKLLEELIPQINVPMVIDADGLNNIQNTGILKYFSTAPHPPVVITPHPGEMARLLNCSVQNILSNRLDLIQKYAEMYNIHIVFKTARTLIFFPDGHWMVNITGNPGLASGGTGDVLAGMIGGFLVQKFSVLESISAAVFLHGLAADIGTLVYDESLFTASDLFDFMNDAFSIAKQHGHLFTGRELPQNGISTLLEKVAE